MSDQERISPNNISTISSKKMMLMILQQINQQRRQVNLVSHQILQ